MAESYSINGTSVTTYLTHLQVIDGNIGVPPMRQDDFVVPGRTGVLAAIPWSGPRVVTFGGIVAGSTRATYQTSLRSLMKLVHNGGRTFTLARALDSTPTSTQATARYLDGLGQVEQLSDRVGRVAFDVQLMDGYFFDTAASSLGTVSGTTVVNVGGDAPTQDVTISYSIGAGSQRVTNAAFPGLGRLTLTPGNNTLTLTGGGSVTISYRAAWL